MPAAVFFCWQGARRIRIELDSIVADRRCSMTAQDVMPILNGKPIYKFKG